VAHRVLKGVNMRASKTTTAARTTLTRMADHPRFLEVTFGRLLELMVLTIEGVRERLSRRVSIH
jgi:hypothetical protein